MIYTEFEQIPLFHYGLIMADPPWNFKLRSKKGEKKSAQAKYDCMSLDAIKRIPVSHFAGTNCMLWLWATNPMLPHAIETMSAWGFDFKTSGHWSKKTKNGKQTFGTGYILRCCGEPYLIGTVGKVSAQVKNVRSVIEAQAGRHSEKPDLAFKEAERLMGDVPRLELFSRKQRKGWDVFGDEFKKQNEIARFSPAQLKAKGKKAA